MESSSPSPAPRLGSTIFKNTAFVTAGNLLLKALSFLFGVFVIRRLGDDRYGQYAIILAFVGLFQIFAEMGMTQFVMREIARNRQKAGQYFWNLVAVRLLLALINILIIPFLAYAYGYASEVILGIFLYTLTFLLAAFEATFQATLTANERLEYISTINVSGQITFMLLGAAFLFSGFSFLWLVVASLLAFIPRLGVGIWAVRRHRLFPQKVQLTPTTWPGLVKSGLPFGVITLTLIIATSIDTVMLSKLEPEYVVGWYNVAYGLVMSIAFLSNGFKDAIVPSLTRVHTSQPEMVRAWYHHTAKLFVALALPLAVGGMILAEPITVFLYKPEFQPAAAALRILVWDIPFLMYAGFCGRITTVIGEERAAARIYTINAAANVLLNLVMIPAYGMLGAAIVTVITDLVSAAQFYRLLRKKLAPPAFSPHLLRIALAAGLMGAGVYATGGLHFFVRIILGSALYLALILLLRLPDEAEWGWIQAGAQKIARLMHLKTT
ncbi:MAG: flippase [Chloroflexota bacterium]